MIPRRKAHVDIKLLRLSLIARPHSPCEEIDDRWMDAQPEINLSPDRAAQILGVEQWAYASVVKKRYLILQTRYPADQFMEKHVKWAPAAHLLSIPKERLNWYWHSGISPNSEPEMTCSLALERLLHFSAI